MGYYIELTDPVSGEVLEIDDKHHMKGGTYQIGGTTRASLSITYNYSRFYYNIFGDKGIRFLYGKTASDTKQNLQEGINILKNNATDDYWEATEGNAKRSLIHLLELAKMRPDGVWNGD